LALVCALLDADVYPRIASALVHAILRHLNGSVVEGLGQGRTRKDPGVAASLVVTRLPADQDPGDLVRVVSLVDDVLFEERGLFCLDSLRYLHVCLRLDPSVPLNCVDLRIYSVVKADECSPVQRSVGRLLHLVPVPVLFEILV
jgi:hypothetical protein